MNDTNFALTEYTGEAAPPEDDPDAIAAGQGRMRRIAIASVLAFVVVVAAASMLVQIGGAVVGSGALGVESRIKAVAHPLGGVISEILVHDGDSVRQGQLLMRLDTTVSGVSADLSGRTADQLLAQRARLLAQREGLGTIEFPPELARRSDESAQGAMASERRLMALRAEERGLMRSQLGERVRQLNLQISGYVAQIGALEKQKALIEPERQGVRKLWEDGLVTINRLNQLERTAVDMDGSIASLQATIAQTRARITETREQVVTIDQTARADAGTELAQVTAALNDQQVRSVSAGDQFARSEIRASAAGTIDKLTATVGGVVQPAQKIMEIVPGKDQLLVEAAISPADVDRVHKGQQARVRLSAFNMTVTPEIPGEVTFVSPERATNQESGASFYRVHVRMDGRAIAREGLALKAGMPAEVFIATGDRSLMSYILKPLRDQFARAFRD